MRFARVLCTTLFAVYLTTQAGLGRATDMKDRIKRIKQSIVRVLVDGQPAGSGFVVWKNGLIATCFHVVQKNEPAANNQTRITYATGIQVEFSNGTRLPGTVRARGPAARD